MSVSRPPLQAPTPNRHTTSFLEGWNRHEFLLRRCTRCARLNEPEADQCRQCAATTFEPTPASNRATLISWCVPHVKTDGGGTEPQGVLALAELAEGPWWWAALLVEDPATLQVGLPVRLRFECAPGSGQRVAVFVPEALDMP